MWDHKAPYARGVDAPGAKIEPKTSQSQSSPGPGHWAQKWARRKAHTSSQGAMTQPGNGPCHPDWRDDKGASWAQGAQEAQSAQTRPPSKIYVAPQEVQTYNVPEVPRGPDL